MHDLPIAVAAASGGSMGTPRPSGGSHSRGDEMQALDATSVPAEFWSWRLWAACRQADRDLFFSPDGERGSAKRRRERAAKAICGTCQVRESCAEYAVGNHERYGVWGGLSEHERELIWRDLDTRAAS
jgi:WhiB family redox-sensing transcriptional regulator